MDPAVLDLHAFEIELAGAPGVLVAAGTSTVVEHRNHQVILGPFGHNTRGHARHEVERVFPGGRLPDTIAPDQRIGQALCLGAGHAAGTILGHASTADRTKARVHGTVHIRLDHQLNVAPVLADDVVHRRRIPRFGVHDLLFAQIDAELVLFGCGSALTVHRPSVGLVAAADDAVVAGDIVLLCIRGDDRQTVDVSLESHDRSSSEHVGQAAVEQFVDALGVDVALVVNPEHVLRQVLSGLTPGLLATGFTVEDRDRAQGIYFVRYVNTSNEEKGFFSKMFSSSTPDTGPVKYRVKLSTVDGKSEVSVQNAAGQAENSPITQQILKLLADDLR